MRILSESRSVVSNANLPTSPASVALLVGVFVTGVAINVPAVSMFKLDEFTGGDSSVVGEITQNGNALNFLLQITKPMSPSDSDLTGFWGHISDESRVAGFVVSNVRLNGTLSLDYVFANAVNGVWSVGGSQNNLNGGGLGGFDFGFFFGTKKGLDDAPINEVSFTLSGSSPLTESMFVDQLFGVRLQPLEADPSSAKLSGTTTTTVSVPETGWTITLLATAVAGLAVARRRFQPT